MENTSLLVQECGLKQKTSDGERLDGVTPCTGVWIETIEKLIKRNSEASLLVQECGLKRG